jgi:hypothetical protein
MASTLRGRTEQSVDIINSKWYKVLHGGMAEWFKAAVLKTVVRKYRGFESYFLRQKAEYMER